MSNLILNYFPVRENEQIQIISLPKNTPNLTSRITEIYKIFDSIFENIYLKLPETGARASCWVWSKGIADEFSKDLLGLKETRLIKIDNPKYTNLRFPHVFGAIHYVWYGKFIIPETSIPIYIAIDSVCKQEKLLVERINQGIGPSETNEIENKLLKGEIKPTNVTLQIYVAFSYEDLKTILFQRYGGPTFIQRVKNRSRPFYHTGPVAGENNLSNIENVDMN